jgi:hypothetical protein
MATITTRNLKGADTAQLSGFSPNSSLNFDKIAITIDPEAYMPSWGQNKWGVFEIDITSFSWANTNSTSASLNVGTLDIRVPQFNSANDWAVANKMLLTNEAGSVSVGGKYFISVNNGMPGPSVFVQPDGSWDLMYLYFDLLSGADVSNQYNATLTYTISFTDLTPALTFAGNPPAISTNPTDSGSPLELSVNNSRLTDSAYITDQVTDYTSKNGYVVVQLNSVDVNAIDTPIDSNNPTANDSVPLLVVTPTTTPGFAAVNPMVRFPCRKITGKRTFAQKLMVFAVNNGFVDGNGSTVKSANSFPNFMRVDLMKLPNWPCDDDFSVAFHYSCVPTVS